MTPDEDPSDSSEEPPLHEIPLSLDAILDILANHRRRALLKYLMEQPENTGSFEDATNHLILMIGQKQGTQPNHDDVQVDLQHHQLPKLADAGIIDYDIRSQMIRYHENERLEMAYERVNDLTID